jgi:hypothetical protein
LWGVFVVGEQSEKKAGNAASGGQWYVRAYLEIALLWRGCLLVQAQAGSQEDEEESSLGVGGAIARRAALKPSRSDEGLGLEERKWNAPASGLRFALAIGEEEDYSKQSKQELGGGGVKGKKRLAGTAGGRLSVWVGG